VPSTTPFTFAGGTRPPGVELGGRYPSHRRLKVMRPTGMRWPLTAKCGSEAGVVAFFGVIVHKLV
jgi:hypothetical protein